MGTFKLFLRQFTALFVKNWVVLAKRPVVNLLQCLLIPLAAGIFLAYAQVFLTRPNNNGLGTMVPVASLADTFDSSLKLLWSDDSHGVGSPTAADIMSHVTQSFSPKQLDAVHKVDTEEIGKMCQQNFNGKSRCFASVTFEGAPVAGSNAAFNYTMRVDKNLDFVDVKRHTSDFEVRLLPLQWAVESAIIELDTGITPRTPLEWPFTRDTTDEQLAGVRLGYVNLVQGLLVIVFFICYASISYHLPGAVVGERASGLTSHMKAMGLLDSARVLSWHLSLTLAYLPAWIIIAVVWQVKIFTGTNVGLVILIHLLLGLSLASWSLFVSVPFGKSPPLAANFSMILGIAFVAVGMGISDVSNGTAFALTLFFPPFFYPVAIRCISGFEINEIPTSATVPDPGNGLVLWQLLVASAIGILLWPCAGALWERVLYDPWNLPRGWGWTSHDERLSEPHVLPPDTAISIRNLGKDFRTSYFKGKKGLVTAISDLSLDIPKHGIFVFLGPNGAGKSTVMSILGNLAGPTRGSVLFEGGVEQPPRGSIGLVPQKNVLFPELTCYQTLRLWRAIKPQCNEADAENEIVQLLRDCDLGDKVYHNAGSLSGGQKRKLQLAIGLIGDSKIVLVDECTSGVDPLSRRSIWRTLGAVKDDRTIVFTTHFLDEADLLADEIAVLATPGKLVAHGNPATLKSTLGEGYTMKVVYQTSSEKLEAPDSAPLLNMIHPIVPEAYVSAASTTNEFSYHLKTTDPAVVQQVLEAVERERDALQVASYSVSASSIEDIFLNLIQEAERNDSESKTTDEEKPDESSESGTPPTLIPAPHTNNQLQLTSGAQRSVFGQALAITLKRLLIFRRSWLAPLIGMAVVLIASCVPLRFIDPHGQTCIVTESSGFPPEQIFFTSPLEYAFGGFGEGSEILAAPPDIFNTLGNATASLLASHNLTEGLADNATFVRKVEDTYELQSWGGVSVDLKSGDALVAWPAQYHTTGLNFLNAASNILYNKALNDSGRALATPKLITPGYQSFPRISAGSLEPLMWAAFFGLAMAIFPAWFTLYVAQERRSSVQAMQFSNGLSNPAGLWLGHLLFDSIFSIIVATILTIVFSIKSTLFHGLGYLWFVMVLYGINGSLFAYCWTIFIKSPIGAFAAVAAYQLVIYGLYLAGYLLTLTYAQFDEFTRDLNTIHFTMSLISPTPNVARAGFISVNLFSLLCEGDEVVSSSSLGTVARYGGPILYLILYGIALFLFLVWVDSGSVLKQALVGFSWRRRTPSAAPVASTRPDVVAESEAVRESADPLRVLSLSKTFGTNKVVDSVSFGVAHDTIFALLGPNGAGKTTTFNMIRGDILPDNGDVLINGHSIIRHTQAARHALGVCPQFTAIDAQLTVRQHLQVYARLKGLRRGNEVRRNVDALMQATGLHAYADRLASKLSGGNQRKLALAIALIGNPSVILIDEFSTGIDAKMKRDMWGTLKGLAVGKAIVITTHSMEEASTLANKVGILSKRMLAVGTTESLVERYATYLVHFPCRSREDLVRAQEVMARIPGARMADDVATRFEVPVSPGEGKPGMSLAELFGILAEAGAAEYAVEQASLESVFMKVIRENEVLEGDGEAKGDRRKWWRLC